MERKAATKDSENVSHVFSEHQIFCMPPAAQIELNVCECGGTFVPGQAASTWEGAADTSARD